MVISGALDYSSKEVQAGLEELLVQLENTTYIDPIYTESWLRSFLDYVERWRDYPDYDQLKTGDEQSFIRTLKDVSTTVNKFSDYKLRFQFFLNIKIVALFCQSNKFFFKYHSFLYTFSSINKFDRARLFKMDRDTRLE